MLEKIRGGNRKSLARAISYVENEVEGYDELLASIPENDHTKIIGITGPPGAGKSTLVDALIGVLTSKNMKVGVLCVDPSSPFNFGALLGDRIRMSEWYDHTGVYIRSLATRGSLGGLHPRIIEITELMKAADFDYVIVETVGVGQSEVEIVGLADITVVVVVPEAGDEVQTMKAGLMEIADIFVVNKADRPGADMFVKNLRLMLAPVFTTHQYEIAVVKTIASQKEGVDQLFEKITSFLQHPVHASKKPWLLTERAWFLIQQYKMRGLNKEQLKDAVEAALKQGHFNLYRFVQSWI